MNIGNHENIEACEQPSPRLDETPEEFLERVRSNNPFYQ